MSRRWKTIRLHLFDDLGMTQSLRKSLYWGIWSVTLGMMCTVVTTGAAWSAFQRSVLKADDFQLGLIAAIPVAANVSQLFISYYVEKKRNRRFLFLFFGLLGRFFWVPIGLMPFLFPGMNIDLRIWIVVVFVVMISVGNSFVNIGFGSLMGDLVPMRIRGQYFGARQKIYLISGVVCGLLISEMIDTLGVVGYSVALVLAGVSAMLDILCFFRVDWPPMLEPDGGTDKTPFGEMIREVWQNKPFIKVVLFYTLFYFAINVAAPFYNVYMLEDLHMSFTQISLYTQIASNLITVFVVARWGRLIDRYGIKPVLQLTVMFTALSPLPYLLATPDAAGWVLLSSAISGVFWPAFELSQQNMYLKQSPRRHRSMYIAIFFACYNLFGVALGNAVGGWLMQNPLMALGAREYAVLGVKWTNSHYIFLLTVLLRIAVYFVLLPRIREEDAWRARDVLRDLAVTAGQGAFRRYLGARAYILRRRERRRMRRAKGKGTSR